MIQLHVTMTSKSFSPRDRWRMLADETHNFSDIKAAREWLRKNYGKSKRQPMYVDENGKSKKIGYVIGFSDADYSHAPIQHWLRQDWIEFRECKTLELA